jgi:hypothetical protein
MLSKRLNCLNGVKLPIRRRLRQRRALISRSLRHSVVLLMPIRCAASVLFPPAPPSASGELPVPRLLPEYGSASGRRRAAQQLVQRILPRAALLAQRPKNVRQCSSSLLSLPATDIRVSRGCGRRVSSDSLRSWQNSYRKCLKSSGMSSGLSRRGRDLQLQHVQTGNRGPCGTSRSAPFPTGPCSSRR